MATRRPGIEALNFHHLRYFWAVASDGNLTRASKRLRVSQSALSAQVRQLEQALGTGLFHRDGRALVLTETGRMVLTYAEEIFATGTDLLAVLAHGRRADDPLRVGSVATLSRNFQESFIAPLLGRAEPRVRLRLQSGRFADLIAALQEHELDVVLSNRPVLGEPARKLRCRRLARQGVSIVGHPRRQSFDLAVDLQRSGVIVPGPDSEIRGEFDAFCTRRGLAVTILAEVDDMASMRLIARDADAVAVVPAIVVRDEIRSGTLRELAVVPGVYETFHAITVARRFQHPRLRELLDREEADILGMRKR